MGTNEFIASVENLVATTESLVKDSEEYVLFRGQSCNKPLLPKIARKDPTLNTTSLEKKMLGEFRRRLARETGIAAMNDWDILIYAQHHRLSTRLLDWTTNPLFALWFACEGYKSNSDGYLYLFRTKDKMLLNPSIEKDPFKIKKTYVLKPNINNSRIRAQSGWFTAHRYSKTSGRFVDLHKNTSIDGSVVMKCIRKKDKLPILKVLDKLGVNEESVYPGPEGTANYINWMHRDYL